MQFITIKWLFLPPYLNYVEKNSNLSSRTIKNCTSVGRGSENRDNKSDFRYLSLQAEMAELCPGGMMYGEKLVYSFRKIRTGSQGC